MRVETVALWQQCSNTTKALDMCRVDAQYDDGDGAGSSDVDDSSESSVLLLCCKHVYTLAVVVDVTLVNDMDCRWKAKDMAMAILSK